jgi:hypothetical protein
MEQSQSSNSVILITRNPTEFNQDWYDICPLSYDDERYQYTTQANTAERELEKCELLKKLEDEINGDFIVCEFKFNPELDIGINGIDFQAKKFIVSTDVLISEEYIDQEAEEKKRDFDDCWTSDGKLLLRKAAELVHGGTIRKALPEFYQPPCKIVLTL